MSQSIGATWRISRYNTQSTLNNDIHLLECCDSFRPCNSTSWSSASILNRNATSIMRVAGILQIFAWSDQIFNIDWWNTGNVNCSRGQCFTSSARIGLLNMENMITPCTLLQASDGTGTFSSHATAIFHACNQGSTTSYRGPRLPPCDGSVPFIFRCTWRSVKYLLHSLISNLYLTTPLWEFPDTIFENVNGNWSTIPWWRPQQGKPSLCLHMDNVDPRLYVRGSKNVFAH